MTTPDSPSPTGRVPALPPPPPSTTGAWPAPTDAPAPPTPVRRARPLTSRTKWMRIAVGTNLAATVLTIAATINERFVLVDIRDGAFVSVERAESSDAFVSWSSVAFMVSSGFAVVMVLRWFSRAYENLGVWGGTKHSTGWAVGAWFVPFLNLYRPYKIAEEIVTASPEPRSYETPVGLRVWWAAFVVSSLIDRSLLRGGSDTVESYITRGEVSTLSQLIWIVAGVALIRLAGGVDRAQRERISKGVALIG